MFRPHLFRPLITAVLLVTLPIVSYAGIYSWVDKRGQKHYGDQIPPKQIKKSHRLLDQQGRTLKTVSAQKTREQALEARRLAAINAETEMARQRKLTQDRTLLSTFSNVKQIDKLMNDRASQIDSLIIRAQSKMEKIEAQLTKAQRMLKLQASRDRSASKQLKLNVIEYKKQVARYERQIERNLQKREDVLSSFQQDRLRFVELKTQIAERKRAEALLDY
jgi:hypothetical protein